MSQLLQCIASIRSADDYRGSPRWQFTDMRLQIPDPRLNTSAERGTLLQHLLGITAFIALNYAQQEIGYSAHNN